MDEGSEATRDWADATHPPAAGEVRIACLVPSLTELLFALDLGDRVVARTGFCVHPREGVRRIPKIGGTKDPDLALLRGIAPTHLIVNVDENRREDVDAARAFVPRIIVTHPQTPADNHRLFRLFGAIFDRRARARELGHALDAALAEAVATTSELPRERVLYIIWKKPWMTVAPETYIAATLACVGWDVFSVGTKRYPEVRDDDAAWRHADRILLSTEPFAFRLRDAEALAATAGRPVSLIDGEWTSWYGARSIEGLRALARFRARGNSR